MERGQEVLTALAAALRDWTAALRRAPVVAPESLDRAATATFATPTRVLAILEPTDRDEVSRLLRVASAHRIPVYPVSRGANWGYGSRVPEADAALIDLSRLDRIRAFDVDLGTITVEPGVTFAQVADRLDGTPLFLEPPGSTLLASVVGNTLERGVVAGVDPARARRVLELEVVLPTGEVLTTGMAGMGATSARGLVPWGLGPDPTGLFLQSNLGVVTALTLALSRRPAVSRAVTFSIVRADRLPALVDAARSLVADRLVDTSVGLYDAMRVHTVSAGYPFGRAGGTPLPGWLRDALASADGAAWVGEAALGAPDPATLIARSAAVEGALSGVVDRVELSPLGAPVAHFGSRPATTLRPAYWRKPAPPPEHADPDRDRCGLVWCAPLVPLRGETVADLTRAMAAVIDEHGFEPAFSLTTLDERAGVLVTGVAYDRDAPGHDHAALACHAALLDVVRARGLAPYRTGVLGLLATQPVDAAHVALLRGLKGLLDPADVLAPGRYDLRAWW